MRVARTVEDLIGSTPLVDLSSLTGGTARVLGKLEAANPGGSAKDRVARAMVDDAERTGRLSPGGTIIEPTPWSPPRAATGSSSRCPTP